MLFQRSFVFLNLTGFDVNQYLGKSHLHCCHPWTFFLFHSGYILIRGKDTCHSLYCQWKSALQVKMNMLWPKSSRSVFVCWPDSKRPMFVCVLVRQQKTCVCLCVGQTAEDLCVFVLWSKQESCISVLSRNQWTLMCRCVCQRVPDLFVFLCGPEGERPLSSPCGSLPGDGCPWFKWGLSQHQVGAWYGSHCGTRYDTDKLTIYVGAGGVELGGGGGRICGGIIVV